MGYINHTLTSQNNPAEIGQDYETQASVSPLFGTNNSHDYRLAKFEQLPIKGLKYPNSWTSDGYEPDEQFIC